MDWQAPAISRALDRWLDEDIGRGDLTAIALQGQHAAAHWLAKQPGRFCGGPLVQTLFERLDPACKVQLLVADGEPVQSGQRLLELEGPATALVAGEANRKRMAARSVVA